MDANGVSQAVVSGGGKPHQIHAMNENALHAVEQYPDRLFGFVRIHPLLTGWEEDMDLYVKEKGFRGVKLHPTQDAYTALDPAIHTAVEKAEELGVPVLVHSGTMPYAMPGQVADLAAAHPKATVIMAHAGRIELYQHTIPSAIRVPNLYLEFSYLLPSAVRGAMSAIGPERVLFGTNWPMAGMRPWIDTVNACSDSFSTRELECFLSGNAERLLKISG